MADPQPPSDTMMILGGIAAVGLVVYLASRNHGNVLQPIPPQTATTSGPIATNTLAMDMSALSDPLLSVPSGAFGGSPTAPGQFVQLPSGTIVPFINGISYSLGSIIHYADGSVQIL